LEEKKKVLGLFQGIFGVRGGEFRRVKKKFPLYS